jgi:hypothetical protein
MNLLLAPESISLLYFGPGSSPVKISSVTDPATIHISYQSWTRITTEMLRRIIKTQHKVYKNARKVKLTDFKQSLHASRVITQRKNRSHPGYTNSHDGAPRLGTSANDKIPSKMRTEHTITARFYVNSAVDRTEQLHGAHTYEAHNEISRLLWNPKVHLKRSQNPATGPCSEPDESSPHSRVLFS